MCTDFSAKEPALGYFYQPRFALYLLLSSRQEENVKIMIESLDDIEIQGSNGVKLFQLKYHLKSKTNLTSRSSDFWKTIRVWAEQIESQLINLDESIFLLITTEKISDSSIIFDIKNKNSTDIIQDKMNTIANETSNQSNIKGYKAFKKLDSKTQVKLIEKIYIQDNSFDFEEISIKIKNELKLSTVPNKIDPMFERLEGWFFNKCILQLKDEISDISFEDVQNQINNINEHFKTDNLPIDFHEKRNPNKQDIEKTKSMNFMKQLDLINSSTRLKHNAISDYYRAFKQRSKWLKDELLNPQEEIDFENRLVDDWSRKFDLLLDDSENMPVSEV